MANWSPFDYAREKRNFIKSRLHGHTVLFHASVIFTLTWLAGWLFSMLLLKFGMTDMPFRYVISFSLAYGVFIFVVRPWAGFMRNERGEGWESRFSDFAFGDAEGCLWALGVLAVGIVVAGVFAFFGGLPLLLEVAFEVVFAGVMVRRLNRIEAIGDWVSRLVRNTWVHASVTLVLLFVVAAWLQNEAPTAKTFSQAIKVFRSTEHSR
jgi:hypothetical protein